MEKERRTNPRYMIRQMIQLGEGREDYIWAKSLDLSRSGMGCVSSRMLNPLDRVFGMLGLEFDGEARDIRFEGYVVRAKPVDEGWELGVSFTDMDSDDSNVLDRFLAVGD